MRTPVSLSLSLFIVAARLPKTNVQHRVRPSVSAPLAACVSGNSFLLSSLFSLCVLVPPCFTLSFYTSFRRFNRQLYLRLINIAIFIVTRVHFLINISLKLNYDQKCIRLRLDEIEHISKNSVEIIDFSQTE